MDRNLDFYGQPCYNPAYKNIERGVESMPSLKRITHKNGRVVYRIVICLGYDGQGNKLVKNLTYSVNQSASARQQEREALKYALDMEDRLKYGDNCGTTKISFENFAAKWLAGIKEEVAYGTYVGYEQLLRSRILPYFKAYKLNCVRTPDIEAFYGTLTNAYAPGTIRRCASVLNCIFQTAVRWNMLAGNPCRDARKPKNKQEPGLRYFTPKQSLIFLKSLNLPCPPERGGYKVPVQFRVFFLLSMFCGFRKGETLALGWDDIDFEAREISITKAIGRTERGFDYKEPKSRTAVRKVPFPENVSPVLWQYRQEYDALKESMGSSWRGNGNLFIQPDGKRMGHTTTYQYFVKHLKRYNRWVEQHPQEALQDGLETLPVIPLHGLRHSCATLLNYLDVNIVDISKYLGHASCSTTMNIYAHSFEEQKRAASDKLNAFLQTSI